MNLCSRYPNKQNLGGKKLLLIAFLVSITSSCNAFLREGELLSRHCSQQKPRHLENTSRIQKLSSRNSRLHALIPEENPFADPETRSVSGVRFASVLSGMDKLFSPQDLDRRNALSRTDGYWPFIQKGQDPPQQFTYGKLKVCDQKCRVYMNSRRRLTHLEL
jgi:hypothetical protein